MNNNLKPNIKEVMQWMLGKQNIQFSYSNGPYKDCEYSELLCYLSTASPRHYSFRVKPKEVHGLECLISSTVISSYSPIASKCKLELELMLDTVQLEKLKSMYHGLLCVLVTKEFFDEAVANKEMK